MGAAIFSQSCYFLPVNVFDGNFLQWENTILDLSLPESSTLLSLTLSYMLDVISLQKVAQLRKKGDNHIALPFNHYSI
jgi:hypothetical protein